MKKDLANGSASSNNVQTQPSEPMVMMAPELVKKLESFLDKQAITPIEDWLDGSTAEDLLGVSTRTLQHYRDTGKLPYAKVGNKIFYKRSDLGAMVERHYQKGGEDGKR